MPSSNHKIGLSLSGGGYRAAAFHLGTLKKLNDLGVLHKVDVISTISGGSIIGAFYNSYKGDFQSFYDKSYEYLRTKNVINRVLFSWLGFRLFLLLGILLGSFYFLFTSYAWFFPIIWILMASVIWFFQFDFLPISKRIEEIYNDFFYNKKALGDLPDRPYLVINSTNLQTARIFSFSKNWMGDTTYQFLDDPVKFKPTAFPLARAVMASSCVPFAFTPISIAKKFFEDPSDAENIHPALVDGGVYDNQGIHKVMQAGRYACDIVITSDAGGGSTGELKFKNTFTLLLETVNVFMSRIKKAQMMRNVYDNAGTVNKQVAYFSLGWDAENCIDGFIKNLKKKQIPQPVILGHRLKQEWVDNPSQYVDEISAYLWHRTGFDSMIKPTPEEKKIARSVGTNLTSLSKKQIDCLINQASTLTELQVKLYCPSLIF